MKRLSNVAAVFGALAALGCGADQGMQPGPGSDGGGGNKPDLLASGGDGASGPNDLATGPGAYPPGPYGGAVGDTFPLLTWQGYVDNAADVVATTLPYGTYGSNDIRQSGRKYAMVHLADFI
jgi:hypothetical protein